MPSAASDVRVVLLHNFLTPYRIPLFAALAQRMDLEVWILGDVRKIRGWSNPEGDPGFHWRPLPHRSVPLGTRDFRFVWNPGVGGALGEARPEVLLICGWDTPAAFQGALWARRTETPYVLWSGSTAAEPNWRRTVADPLVRWMVRGASAWAAYGTRARDYLVHLGAAEDRVFLAWNTVDLTPFEQAGRARESAPKPRGWPSTRPVVLFSGQLIRRKGVHDLLEGFRIAAQKCPELGLVFAGDGPMAPWLRKRAAAAKLEARVRLLGFVQRADLPACYAAASLLALPSHQEVWGLVVNEALACGTPVLATEPVGAAADLVTHGHSGYVVPAADPDAVAKVLEDHFATYTDLSAMRHAAQEAVAPFTIERSAAALARAVRAAQEVPR